VLTLATIRMKGGNPSLQGGRLTESEGGIWGGETARGLKGAGR